MFGVGANLRMIDGGLGSSLLSVEKTVAKIRQPSASRRPDDRFQSIGRCQPGTDRTHPHWVAPI
jgi:hypothetical protein